MIGGKIKELEAENTRLQETVALYQRLHNKLMHEKPEKSGRYFICGEIGEKDSLGLPDKILVCPTYGLDGFQLYKKDGHYSAPGW